MGSSYGRSQFDLTVEIDGVEHQAVQCSASFSLNAIPRATAMLAVGRNARNVGEVAKIHSQAESLVYLKPAKIHITAKGTFSRNQEQWPGGRKTIFEGYLTGLSYRKSNGQVHMVAELIHWLADLQFSSCISETSHPDNPFSYTYRALPMMSGAGSSQPTWLNRHSSLDYFTKSKCTSDFWGSALQPFFCDLAKEDLFHASNGDAPTIDRRNNREALKALQKMPGGGCSSTSSKYYVPLQLKSGPLGEELGEGISSSIQGVIGDSDFYQSFWDNLVGKLGPEFCFSVVPMVDKAFPAPIVPGYQTTYRREILATDQEYVDFQTFLPRPLRGISAYNSLHMETQLYRNQDQPNPNSVVADGGGWSPKDGSADLEKGQILVRRIPPWISAAAASIRAVGASDTVHTKSATTPDGGGPKAKKMPSQVVKDSKDLCNWYCHYLYMCEVLRGRNGTVAGKLRFDIGPGTNVKIQGHPERFIGAEDQLGTDMVGMVHTVTYALDAEQARAGTGFGITHLRTVRENESDRTSISEHPVYSQAFTGSPLHEDYAF